MGEHQGVAVAACRYLDIVDIVNIARYLPVDHVEEAVRLDEGLDLSEHERPLQLVLGLVGAGVLVCTGRGYHGEEMRPRTNVAPEKVDCIENVYVL